MRRYRTILFLLLSGLLLLPAATPVTAQAGERCFPATGFCISGPIRAYWEANGGLPVFGYPTTAQISWTVEGQGLPVQWFERDRLEIQPAGYVTAGRLGARLLELRGTPWETFPKAEVRPEQCLYFEITGHTACPPFSSYWLNNGGLERFGYPITQPFEEVIDGQSYLVQYFERRRMEIHPELPGSPILFGLLGNEVRDAPTPHPCDFEVVPGLEPHLAAGTYQRIRLGCPGPQTFTTVGMANAAEQYFERGVMLYLRAPGETQGTIYVIKSSPLPVVYRQYPDSWTEEQPEAADLNPPPGLYEPRRGFGQIWREQPGVREALGWATMPERPAQITYQRFENGQVLWMRLSDFVYTLFGNGGVYAGSRLQYHARGRITYLKGNLQANEIYVMDQDGGRQINVTRSSNTGSSNYWPGWGRQGHVLAFVSDRAGAADIFTVNADATDLRNLTNTPDIVESYPDYAPDGKQIVFMSNRDGNEDIYLMNNDGSQVRRLTEDAGSDSFPRWSPDGRRIAFISSRAGGADLFVMNSDGSDVRNLSNSAAYELAPQWSPDGEYIAFVLAEPGSASLDIGVVKVSDGSYRKLTTSTANDQSFGWAPDSRRIAFSSAEGAPADLFIINIDGTGLAQITDTPAFAESSPTFSPSGNEIAFASNRDSGNNIYKMAVYGGNLQQLTSDGDSWQPLWLR